MKLHNRLLNLGATAALVSMLLGPAASTLPHNDAYAAPSSQPFASAPFLRTWQRTDRPVSMGQVQRSFFWGPEANSVGLLEDYEQGVGGKRLVQYYDKSRMEINNPSANPSDPFFVTNGLLTIELISGRMQVGDASYVTHSAADIPLASDTNDPDAPTYISFQGVSNTPLGNHFANTRVGQYASATINKAGQVGDDPSKANLPATKIAQFNPVTNHNIPQVFWGFLNLTGPVYVPATGQNVTGSLSDPWFYATGYPISEPFWAKVKIANVPNVDVLIQAYERRVLTYVPSAPQGFQVQMSNIGQHYYDWRYASQPPQPAATQQLPADPTDTPTAIPTHPVITPTRTKTPTPSPNAHTAAQYVGTWLNDDPTTGHVSKIRILANGKNLTLHAFSDCGDSYCDLGINTKAYTSEPFTINLDEAYPLSLNLSFTNNAATKIKVVWQNTEELHFHRATASDYVGAWLNDSPSAKVPKLWITNTENDLRVQWFEVCGTEEHLCDRQAKTKTFDTEPFEITLDGNTLRISLDNAAGNELKVGFNDTSFPRLHKTKPADYDGTWQTFTGEPHHVVTDRLKMEISHNGKDIHVKSYVGICIDLPCQIAAEPSNARFVGEPIVLQDEADPYFFYSVSFDNAAGTRLKILSTHNSSTFPKYLDKQP